MPKYAIEHSEIPTVAIAGTDATFPVRRISASVVIMPSMQLKWVPTRIATHRFLYETK